MLENQDTPNEPVRCPADCPLNAKKNPRALCKVFKEAPGYYRWETPQSTPMHICKKKRLAR